MSATLEWTYGIVKLNWEQSFQQIANLNIGNRKILFVQLLLRLTLTKKMEVTGKIMVSIQNWKTDFTTWGNISLSFISYFLFYMLSLILSISFSVPPFLIFSVISANHHQLFLFLFSPLLPPLLSLLPSLCFSRPPLSLIFYIYLRASLVLWQVRI